MPDLKWQDATNLPRCGASAQRLVLVFHGRVAKLSIPTGSYSALGDLFGIEGTARTVFAAHGNLRHVKDRSGMTSGTITIRGDVGACSVPRCPAGRSRLRKSVTGQAEMRGDDCTSAAGSAISRCGCQAAASECARILVGGCRRDIGLAMRRADRGLRGSGDGLGRASSRGRSLRLVRGLESRGQDDGTLALFGRPKGSDFGSCPRSCRPGFRPPF